MFVHHFVDLGIDWLFNIILEQLESNFETDLLLGLAQKQELELTQVE